MNWINSEKQESEKTYPFARWVSWLCLVASVLLLIYTYYRAEIIFQGDKQWYYFKYYLISLIGVLFFGIVLRLREEVRANIVTVVTTLVVGLYMAEGGLTLLSMKQPNSSSGLGGLAWQACRLELPIKLFGAAKPESTLNG